MAIACSCNPNPAAPSGAQPPAARTGATLLQARGYVSDTAFQPLAGVQVEVLDGPTAGASATSGADGWFSVTVPFDRDFTVRATKAGYVTVLESFSTYTTSYGTFFRGYVSLASTESPAVFEPGPYSVTLDFPCTWIPADLRTQTFPATVTARPNAPPGTSFIARIDDTRFNTPFNFNTIEFGVARNEIGVRNEVDLWWEVPTFRYFDALIIGTRGLVPPGSTATFSTRVDLSYCELNAPKGVTPPTDNCTTVPAAQVITRDYCPDGRLTLAPR